jgi:hypothetical protein
VLLAVSSPCVEELRRRTSTIPTWPRRPGDWQGSPMWAPGFLLPVVAAVSGPPCRSAWQDLGTYN